VGTAQGGFPPDRTGKKGRTAKDNRLMVNGIEAVLVLIPDIKDVSGDKRTRCDLARNIYSSIICFPCINIIVLMNNAWDTYPAG